VRDFCIGIEFVTADGSRVKGGGRVVKNVAGYDLMKLLIGSYGTLGVITSANFKVFPLPKQTRTFVAEFAAVAEAIACRDRIVTSPVGINLMAMEIVSPRAHEYLAEREVRDPDHYHPSAPIQQTNTWSVYLRAAGSDAVLARYQRELGGNVGRIVSGEEERELWSWMSDFEATTRERHQNAMIVHIATPIAEVRAAIEAAEQAALEHNFISAMIGRISTGNLVCAMLPLSVDPPSAVQFAAAASSLRARLSSDSSAVVTACPLESKRHFDVWGGTPTDTDIMRAIRATLDPNQVLNRGRFIPSGSRS
jgi:glycolate oxidase FAD binding subunit